MGGECVLEYGGCMWMGSVYWGMGDVYGGKCMLEHEDGYGNGGNEAEELGKCQSGATLFICHAEKFGLWRLGQ